jgi:hypothetical protein
MDGYPLNSYETLLRPVHLIKKKISRIPFLLSVDYCCCCSAWSNSFWNATDRFVTGHHLSLQNGLNPFSIETDTEVYGYCLI